MSHWVAPAQPPLTNPPTLHVGTGLLDDPVTFARDNAYEAAKQLAKFAAVHIAPHPTLKAVLGAVTPSLIDIAVGRFPDNKTGRARKREREKKSEAEDGTGVGASRATRAIRPIVRNPNVRRFVGDLHNEAASRFVDHLVGNYELKRAQSKWNQKRQTRRTK